MKEFKAKAAVVFEDTALGEMLTEELRLAGFSLVNEDDADLLLVEADILPYIREDKITAVFLSAGIDPGGIRADAVFPYIFSAEELEATLKRLCLEIMSGRERPASVMASSPESGKELEIKALPDGKSAIVGNERISLSSNEWAILAALCKAREVGKCVSREELGRVIGHGEGEGGNIVDVYVCHLRKKIEFPIGRRLIFTHRGEGYSLLNKMEDRHEKRI